MSKIKVFRKIKHINLIIGIFCKRGIGLTTSWYQKFYNNVPSIFHQHPWNFDRTLLEEQSIFSVRRTENIKSNLGLVSIELMVVDNRFESKNQDTFSLSKTFVRLLVLYLGNQMCPLEYL